MIAISLPRGLGHALSRERVSRESPAQIAAAYDAALVRQFNAGNEAAFVEIVARFRGRIFATAFSLVHNRADADDITQDTFIRAYRGLARFRGDSSLATWLHCITANLSRNFYWYFVRHGRRNTISLDFPLADASPQTFADLLVADSATPARLAAHHEFLALVTSCMTKLHAPHREILTLRTALDQSYEQIAVTLGIDVGTVKSRIGRARASLRRLIGETCPEFAAGTPLSEWFEPRHASSELKITRN